MKTILVLILAVGVARADAITDPTADTTKATTKATVDAWLAAQNQGDFDAYVALYDPSFVGIKRTSDGGETKLKLKKWKADRKKMFAAKQEVVAENVQSSDDG